MEITYNPTWKEYEKGLTSKNKDEALKSAEAFDVTRKKETLYSKKAREWEKSRKEAWAKDKPKWVKEQIASEKDEVSKIAKGIKDFGSLDSGIRPYRGFILVKPVKKDQQTVAGIILPDSAETKNDIAEIIAVGSPIYLDSETLIYPEVSPGDRVLLKKFAGIDITVKGESCKICQFTDILGVLE